MNLKSILLIALLTFLGGNFSLKAQDSLHQNAISVGAGFSVAQIVFDADWGSFDPAENLSAFSYPAIQVSYDRRTNEWFSFGVSGSWQFYGIDVENELLFDDLGNVDSISYSVSLVRSNFSVRPLLHWKLNNPNMELYTGIRMGITTYSFDNGTNRDVSIGVEDMEQLYYRTRFAFTPQFIPLGYRGYFTENIGMAVEFAIGSPHFFSLGFVGRF